MFTMPITKAEFIRQMTPGLKLRLMSNLRGDDGRIRTVSKVNAREVKFLLPAGEPTWLVFCKDMKYAKTTFGYTVTYDIGNTLEYHLV